MLITDYNGNLVSRIDYLNLELLNGDSRKLTIVYDTEFSTKQALQVLSIQLYFPDLAQFNGLIELNPSPSFNPFLDGLNSLGVSVEIVDNDILLDSYESIENLIFSNIEGISNGREIRKIFKAMVEQGGLDEYLKPLNLTRNCVKLNRDRHHGYSVSFNLPKLQFDLTAHFAQADLFKFAGKDFYKKLFLGDVGIGNDALEIDYGANLESKRVVTTTMNRPIALNSIYLVNGYPYEFNIRLKDTIARLPVLSGKGLDNQCRVYRTDYQKLNVETEQLAINLGLSSIQAIKEKMDVFREKDLDLFIKYAIGDVFATYSLGEKLQELMDNIRCEYGLEPTEIRDTTGSNVSKFISDLQLKHFHGFDSLSKKAITHQRKLGHTEYIQNSELNAYGVQSLRTVGGLLFTRTAREPYLSGYFGDLDMSGCYATALSNLNIYLGTPVITTFRNKSDKPKLKEVLPFLLEKCPRDGWIVRVSGEFETVTNTLLLSDLAFKPKKIKSQTIFDVLKSTPNRKSINKFDLYKVADKEAQSTLLTKQCKFSLINHDLLDCINLMPEPWIEEYLNLAVDCIAFIPNELIVDTLQELEIEQEKYPETEDKEIYKPSTGLKVINQQYCKDNVCLRFPISEYYRSLKDKRSIYKKAKNPIQEVYKLILNSGYGALACYHLGVNNPMAANQITCLPRSTAWLMINALNGFQVITDGATFSWQHIPIGKKFKDLAIGGDYLIDYDSSLKNEIPVEDYNQAWIDENFHQHLKSFYGVQGECVPIDRFSFELKDENFEDSNGKTINTTTFTEFFNSGSGNYVKGLGDCKLLIQGQEYVFNEQRKKVKARSFKGDDKALLDWYCHSLKDGYLEPKIYSEGQIIKFAEGNQIAISFLNPKTKIYSYQYYEKNKNKLTAYTIANQFEKDGRQYLELHHRDDCSELAHPMGFSTKIFKIMKLITRSQFLFQNEKQLRNFEKSNQLDKFDRISKDLLTKTFWDNLKLSDVEKYGVEEIRLQINYFEFSKQKPIGLGFEIMALKSKFDGDVKAVRNLLADKIKDGCKDFNASLKLSRYTVEAKQFKLLFASIIILKANTLDDLKQVLINSKDNPTSLSITRDNIFKLQELLGSPQ